MITRCGFYTAKDLSKIFRVNISTIFRWKHDKKIPAGTKVSHKMRIWSQKELHEYFPTLFEEPIALREEEKNVSTGNAVQAA